MIENYSECPQCGAKVIGITELCGKRVFDYECYSMGNYHKLEHQSTQCALNMIDDMQLCVRIAIRDELKRIIKWALRLNH